MAKKKKGDEGGGYNWMDTYGDMVTLLLTFFIMLFSMSSVEQEKWEMLVLAFTNRGNETSQIIVTPIGNGHDMAANQGEAPLPSDGESIDTTSVLPSDFSELFQYLQSYVEENNLDGSVEVSEGDGMVYIQFQDNIFFNPDQFVLRQEARPILTDLGGAIHAVEDQILVINVSGHTAAVEIENYPVSDWMLSGQRAASVTVFLEEEVGIDSTKMIDIGYGKSRPVGDNSTPEGRQRNRRVDMMIVSNQATPDSEQLLKSLLAGTYDESMYPKSGGLDDLLNSVGAVEGVDVTTPDAAEPPEPEGEPGAGEAIPAAPEGGTAPEGVPPEGTAPEGAAADGAVPDGGEAPAA